MSSTANAQDLLLAIKLGKLDEAKVALEAGADVNGTRDQPYSPLASATIAERVDIIKHLLEQGADPDKPVTHDYSCSDAACAKSHSALAGERSLHIAAKNGTVEIARLLLNEGRADPNATDDEGHTPLMVVCNNSSICMDMMRLLLEAGADPALANKQGHLPLYAVAHHGHTDAVDMLYTAAPATLHHYSADNVSPLYGACAGGHESVVSKLLSLGAMQRMPLDAPITLPLTTAVINGFEGVVRVLMSEGGITAVGGEMALAHALYLAIQMGKARIIQQLLEVDGEEGRSEWANTYFEGMHLLHCCAAWYFPAAVSILLEAGADETARDSEMRIPREVIGSKFGRAPRGKKHQEKEVAIRRMLDRGPAYRARSWAWHSGEEADASGSGRGDTVAAAAAAANAVLSSLSAIKPAYDAGVRIFRPTEKRGNTFFVRLVGRYCEKD